MAQALRRTVGGALLLTQPLVIAVQLLVATRWSAGDYDLRVNTISDLGAVSCTTIGAAYGPVAVCSPWHALMNAAFVVIGACLALGAVLVSRDLAGRRTTWVAGLLLVVSGVSSLAVGLAPLDSQPEAHTLVALPVFVAQPVALVLLGIGWRHALPRVARALLVAGVVAAAGGITFGATLVLGEPGGLYERISLWSCHLGVALVGTVMMRGLVLEDG
ncbi:DUF998 domain-containing protein [Nocardioides sp.]|uniref:DUF998 domain-containing protein n=1 Tax=Nocardioides sp. TaxID=35761 RepID=UPI00286C76BC|nr:DUF998 domain-containing protein [Nocardioides sp.]